MTALETDKKNRSPLITRRKLLTAGLAGGAVLAGSMAYDTEILAVSHHRLSIPGLRGPLRLAQVSDLHRSWCVSEHFIARVVDRVNGLLPDAVLLTGDFVTARSDYIGSCVNELKRLHAPQGLYAVLGNHDYACDRWKGAPAVTEGLAQIGVKMLTNAHEKLDCGLKLVGLDDFDTGNPDPDLAFGRVEKGEPILAMTHNPLLFEILRGYDCLTLAGHTHGGQIDIPWLTRLILDERARYLKGWFHSPGWPGRMYVSRGLGVIGIPARLNAAPEIALFELTPEG